MQKKRLGISLPARASVWYTAASVLERGSAFLFTPILTRILSPEEFGIYPLYVSWMGVFTVLCTLEISGTVIYKGLMKFEDRDEFISASFGLMATASAVMLILYILFRDAVNATTGLSTEITLVLLSQIFLTGAQNIYLSRCRYAYRYRQVTAINIFSAIFSPALTLAFISLTELRGEARIIAPLTVSAFLSVPLIIDFIMKGRKLISRDKWKFLLKFSLPLLPHFLSASVIAQAGKIITGRFFGEGDLAKYSVAFSLGFLLSILTGGIHAALHPWINRKLLSGDGERLSATVSKIFWVVGITALLFLLIIPEIFSVLAPSEYSEALRAVYPITISVLISFLGSIIYSVITYFEATYLVTAASVSSALVSLTLNFALTARFGYMAAAMIQPISAALTLALNCFALRLVTKRRTVRLYEPAKTMLLVFLLLIPIYAFRDVLASRILLLVMLGIIMIPRLIDCRAIISEQRL